MPTANLGVRFPFTSLVCPGWLSVVFCRAASTSPCRLYDAPPQSLLLLPLILHLSSFRGAAGFQDATTSGLLVPLADCHDASRCAAAASRPHNDPPPPVCKRLPSRWPLVRQLVAPLVLSARCLRLLSFTLAGCCVSSRRAASAYRPLINTAAS